MSDFLETTDQGFQWLKTLPWLMLLGFAIPLLLLARSRIHPHRSLLIIGLIPCGLVFGVLVRQDIFLVILVADLAVLAVALVDVGTLPRLKHFSVEREAGRIASLRKSHVVNLVVNNDSRVTRQFELRDDLPPEFEANPPEFTIRLQGRSRALVSYDFRSQRRGAFTLSAVHLRVRSRLGLWNRLLSYPCETVFHVYPDMKQLAEYAVLARTNRLSLMGVRRVRRIGQDNEFERLRDYTLDDNYKHIEWRSTARRNRLTVKDFQVNQSQRIIFLLDCGRMMTSEANRLSLLDHSLNAMLMLSYVALRQGDSVGLICFSDAIHTYVPPRGGMKQMNQLLHASFDRFPELVESRYDQAFLYLATHCPKRSLVILISNVIDEVNSHQIQQYLGTLVGRHLPLGVLLRDQGLFHLAEKPNPQGNELYAAAAAAEILTWRHQVLTDLEHQGVLSLDVFPEDMTAPLVNRYLDIKARHLL